MNVKCKLPEFFDNSLKVGALEWPQTTIRSPSPFPAVEVEDSVVVPKQLHDMISELPFPCWAAVHDRIEVTILGGHRNWQARWCQQFLGGFTSTWHSMPTKSRLRYRVENRQTCVVCVKTGAPCRTTYLASNAVYLAICNVKYQLLFWL